MRVLLAHKFFKYTGGAEVFFLETGRVLEERGHDVAYFSTIDPDNLACEYSDYFVEPPHYSSGSLIKRVTQIGRIIYSSEARQKFAALIEAFQPDVVHVFAIHVHLTPSILIAAHEVGVPVLMSCNDYKHICPNYKLYDGSSICEACKGGKFYNAVLKRCCKDSLVYSVASALEAYIHESMKIYDKYIDRYLFASDFMLNKTREFWPDKRVDYGVLKNPFDVSRYQPIYDGEYVLYFGRIVDEKGVDRIIAAARQVDVPIRIIGDGPDLERLKSEVQMYGLSHIEFLGPMWGEALDRELYGARFVIVPSLWHENFPYVIFQAFAAGKPVLGSRRGGIPELVGDDRGLLFDPDNIAELATRMKGLWQDPEGCRRMGVSARAYIEREYSDETFYQALLTNYQAVIR